MLTDMTYFFPFELLSYKPVTETPPLLINEISSFLAVFRQKKNLETTEGNRSSRFFTNGNLAEVEP
jgi:hypothetical protein